MFYDGKLCDGCAEIMHEGDDIVVCPVCGTPQHRECYNKNKQCVNEHLHSEGFDWQKENCEPACEAVTEPEHENPESKGAFKLEILNADEQSEILGDMPDIQLPGISVAPVLTDGQGLKPDDEFDGIKVSEALTYTQISAGRYLRKFYKNRGKKHLLSWNWAAFIFSPAWFFYRKLYKLGAFFLALTVAGTLIATPFAETINDNYEGFLEAYEVYTDSASEYSENENAETEAAYNKSFDDMKGYMNVLMPAIGAFFALAFIVPNTLAALIADGEYRRKMLEDIAVAKRATQDEKILKYSLLRRGGVSMFAGLIVLFAENYLPSIIMSIVSNFI